MWVEEFSVDTGNGNFGGEGRRGGIFLVTIAGGKRGRSGGKVDDLQRMIDAGGCVLLEGSVASAELSQVRFGLDDTSPLTFSF